MRAHRTQDGGDETWIAGNFSSWRAAPASPSARVPWSTPVAER